MIVIFIVAIIAAFLWTAFVVMANGMSDAPTLGFQGGGSIISAWAVVVILGVAWWVG